MSAGPVCGWCLTGESHVCAAGGAGLSDALRFWALLVQLGTEAFDGSTDDYEYGRVEDRREAFRERLRERMAQAATIYDARGIVERERAHAFGRKGRRGAPS